MPYMRTKTSHGASMILGCLVVLFTSSCADSPQYIPGPEYASGLSGSALVRAIAASQKAALKATAERGGFLGLPAEIIEMHVNDESDIAFTLRVKKDNSVVACHYKLADRIDQGIQLINSHYWFLTYGNEFAPIDANSSYKGLEMFWTASDRASAETFINGMVALHHSPPGAYAAALKEEATAFASAVSMYRGANPKPGLPSDAQMYATQANDAVSRNDRDEAILLYQKALESAPWWPAGHYNLAVLMGGQQDYDDAIDEMRKYLELVPDAPDAQKAQQQIWIWQGRASDHAVTQ